MRKNLTGLSIFILLLSIFFVSCKNELLPVPIAPKVQKSTTAPENFTVSHGRQKIYLSWNSVDGAKRYKVYASKLLTPVEESFELVDEIVQPSDTGKVSCEIDVASGAEAYYRVTAILASGKSTDATEALRATSIAVPEITGIETDSLEASTLIVYWNMSNCRNDTYRLQTEYEITCTSSSDQTDFYKYTVKASALDDTQYRITDLNPHSTYKIKVVARTELGDTTESPELSIETLHRMQPGAPVNLTAGYGISKNGITLEFTLPEKADMQLKDDGSFEKAPVIFEISRKNHDSDNWEKIINPQLKLEDGTALNAEDYPDDGGITVTYTDTGVPSRGTIYDYKVQSYIDLESFKNLKSIDDSGLKNYNYIQTSSTVSSAETYGWALTVPVLSVENTSSVVTGTDEDEETVEIKNASADINFVWDNFLFENEIQNEEHKKQFKYLLYEDFTPFDCDNSIKTHSYKFIYAAESLSALTAYSRSYSVFDLEEGQENERGIYGYTVYIVKSDAAIPAEGATEEPSDYFDKVTTPAPVYITDNTDKIEDFNVKGGYKDKFVITWKAENDVRYTLTYSETQDGVTTVNNKIVQDYDNASLTAGPIEYEHTFNQEDVSKDGITRTYRLTASTSGATTAPASDSKEAKSLGTPVPEFDVSGISYDSITVRWKKVQMADGYKIELAGKEPVEIVTTGEDKNVYEAQDDTGNTYYSYTFDASYVGEDYYTDAKKSGSDIACKITATSKDGESDLDYTENTVQTRTLGPATLNLDAAVAKSYNFINVKWERIEGAKYYQVLRRRYKADGQNGNKTTWSQDDEWEAFVVNAENLSVSANGEAYGSMSVSVDGSKFSLIDTYQKLTAEQPSQSDVTQSRISWGIPVEYLVFPLLSENDEFDGEKLKGITYANVETLCKKGSAIGYGLNVTAGKADSGQYIEIKWDAPYTEGSDTGLIPQVYRRQKNSSSDFTLVTPLIQGDVSYKHTRTTSGVENTKAYEYAVKYVAGGASQGETFVSSYADYLKSEQDTNGEPKAVGYLFYLPEFTASNIQKSGTSEEGFTEAISYTPWNYDERKNGPDSYTIWTKNKNNAEGWFKIATITRDGTISLTEDPGWYDTDIQLAGNGLTLTPKNVNDASGATDGLLKVQRDYKHYYMIQAERKADEKTVYTYLGLDESVWTYRRISGEELSKAAMLTVADMANTHITGNGTGTDGKTLWKVGNQDTVPHFGWSQNAVSQFKWKIKGYYHTYTELPGGTYTSDNPFKMFIKISDENTNNSFRGQRETTKLMHLSTETSTTFWGRPEFSISKRIPLIVEPNDINGPCVSYGGTVNFAVSSNDIAITLKRGDSQVFDMKITGNRNESFYWCPINLDNRGYKGKDAGYRWWLVREGDTKTQDFVWEVE